GRDVRRRRRRARPHRLGRPRAARPTRRPAQGRQARRGGRPAPRRPARPFRVRRDARRRRRTHPRSLRRRCDPRRVRDPARPDRSGRDRPARHRRPARRPRRPVNPGALPVRSTRKVLDGYVTELATLSPDAAEALGTSDVMRVPDLSPEAFEARAELDRRTLTALESMPPTDDDDPLLRLAATERLGSDLALDAVGFT